MAITQGQCTIFKLNQLKGLENFDVGTPYTYKVALYTAEATLDESTTAYSVDNEVVDVGYIAGGATLTPIPPASSGSVAYVSFQDVTWAPASFTTRGALIYNATTMAAVAVLNFGADKTATSTFTITFPVATATSAVIRNI